MSPPILHSRWYEEKSWIYFYSMESLAGVGVAHQVEISVQQPGPATAPLQAGVAADHWSPVRRGWSSAWPQQPPSLEQILPDSSLTGDAAKPHLLPSALAPTFSRSQVQEKVQPRNHLLQWAPKLTQNRFCGLMNSIQTVGRQCLWSFIYLYYLLFKTSLKTIISIKGS